MNKKRLLIFICFILVIVLSSCSSKFTLKRAFAEMNETTYSIKGTIKYKTTIIKDGQEESESTSMGVSAKCDKDKMLITYDMGLKYVNAFYKIEGEYLKSYLKERNTWVFQDIEEISKYDNLVISFEYNSLKKFEKCGNVYYGECNSLNEEAKDTFISFCEEALGETEFELTEFGFNRYNVVLVENQVNYLDIESFMTLTCEDYSVKLVVTEVYRIFDMGEVVVEEPSGLPIE